MKLYKNIKILLIEDEDYDVRRVKNTLALIEGAFKIKSVVSSGNDALNLLKADPEGYDIVIMDYQIAGGLRGEELIRDIKYVSSLIQVIVITKHTINITDFDFANVLLEAGAFWYCTKYPGDIEDFIYQPTDFIVSLFNAYEKRELEKSSYKSNKKLNRNIEDILSKKVIIGNSPLTVLLQETIEKLARGDINVLINGDSGTGKELVATNIHYRSGRRFENFVPINCGSIPSDLIESELFGYEKGAFTGANTKKAGLFEIADNGTVFLDEVAELPQSAQVKLLRFLQEGEIEKLGRTQKIKVNVRVIAATNKKLEDEVRAGRFREDLYYRLNVVPVYIKPLRERREDIRDLIHYYLDFYCRDMGMSVPNITPDAMEFLLNHEWPGNVRELKNLIQRLLFFFRGEINLEGVKSSMLKRPGIEEDLPHVINFKERDEILPLREVEREFRKKYFTFVRENSTSDAEAAKKMGLAPPNLHRMLKELGIK